MVQGLIYSFVVRPGPSPPLPLAAPSLRHALGAIRAMAVL